MSKSHESKKKIKKAPKKSAKERKAEKREKKLLIKGGKNIELKKVFEESVK